MIDQWAAKWGVPPAALQDLYAQLTYGSAGAPGSSGLSESAVQANVRLEAARAGLLLWRNNVGALQAENGRVVRFGLANDSKQLNARIKSGDLIGIRPVLITPAHVGTLIGQFVSRECKEGAWRWTGTEREVAQAAWVALVSRYGGDAGFACGPGTFNK